MKKSSKQRLKNIRNSLRTKVNIGFLGLAILLVFSSIVSLVELREIGTQTQAILTASKDNMTLASEMLDVVEERNIAMQECFLSDDFTIQPNIQSIKDSKLAVLLKQAHEKGVAGIDSIETAYNQYCQVTEYDYSHIIRNDRRWFLEEYTKAHHKLLNAIQEYMQSSQTALGPQALSIKNNAYRAITPSVVTVGALLIIVLMLWYFLNRYGVRPILKINRALSDYQQYKLPYKTSINGNDEINQLNDKIEDLIQRIDDKKQRQDQQ